jgi:hypothetical protein
MFLVYRLVYSSLRSPREGDMCYAPPFSFPSDNSILNYQNSLASEVFQARSLRGHSIVSKILITHRRLR